MESKSLAPAAHGATLAQGLTQTKENPANLTLEPEGTWV